MQPDILSLSKLFMLTGTIVISCDVIQRIKMELEQRQENAVSSPRLRDFPTVSLSCAGWPNWSWIKFCQQAAKWGEMRGVCVSWCVSVRVCVCGRFAWHVHSPPCWDNVCLDLMFAVRCQENSELLMIGTLLLGIKEYMIVLLTANIVFVSTAC